MPVIPIFAQALSIIAMTIALLSFQQKTQKRIVLFQFCSSFLFAVHFLLLGAITGALLNFMAAVRALIYSKRDQKWAASPFWILLFSILPIGIYGASFAFFGIAPTLANLLLELLPTLGMISTTISFRMKQAAQVRLFSLISSPLWLIYNIFNFSIGGILTESFSLISILVGILRLDLKKEQRKSR